ncbi:anti-CBASS protein Acb1 family protein [Dyella caseinilytica]|uniref:DUF1073 domain-containing protein n=1 Tax=Dyella caseinilytica TaxID=1849581 RepID=A0ABX7GY41_9GAMM|nr:anti-CBASS Acb1 family protein [Dyella caseinilytica]QRN55245.1 DUF1073 domain-containing protein [Dyella caseinilytica]GGA00383.1 hypothetical protein GCM10011408_21630 [Dyella caseinilytica]
MSEFDGDSASSVLTLNATLGSPLYQFLTSDAIVPGSSASYELCKTIFAYHPLGMKIAEEPIKRAQSQSRLIKIGTAPDRCVEAFQKAWDALGTVGADTLIRNTHTLSRVYGIASLAVLAEGTEPKDPLPFDRLHELKLSFNVLDPLNTAGSLVMNQDPNDPGFMKPTGVAVSGRPYHNSRTSVLMNGQPLYIEWSSSAYGFVGRSVYQSALYPLKTYIQTMITDQAVTEKAAVLVMKLKSPGNFIDKVTRAFYSIKRTITKGARTGNVVSIGVDEDIAAINYTNLKDAAEFARTNCIKNIATATPMPASMIDQETFASGLAEGTEDAKREAVYVQGIRKDIEPLYRFLDVIVMHQAWTPEFYESIQREFPKEYGEVPYETAFSEWKNSFKATWPNLLEEPDSEKVKTDDVVTKAAIAAFEVLAPNLDPVNKARLAKWVSEVFASRPTFEAYPMDLDEEAIAEYEPPVPEMEPKPVVESSHE